MYLVDTSVWINHFRKSDTALIDALNENLVYCHPFVIGELALGSIKDREIITGLLNELPPAVVADDGEVMQMIETHRLFGKGLGYIDAHLLASALISGKLNLWTADKRLDASANKLGVVRR